MPDSKTIVEQTGKVAEITLAFWVLKIITTTIGDLSGDVLSISLGMGYATALVVALAIMGALLVAQLSTKRFNPLLYWSLILLSSTVGAEFSDSIDRVLHWGTPAGAVALLVCLVVLLMLWRLRRRAIGTYPIKARQDEMFYWGAVIFANSLGSVLGDLVGDRLGLGVTGGVALNAGVLVLLAVLYYRTKVSSGILFWTAFVFARVSF